MEIPKFDLPLRDFEIPFCPRHQKFSPIIEREKFRKMVDKEFMKTVSNHLVERIDDYVLFYLKGVNKSSGIRFQNNKVSYIKNLFAGLPEWEYTVDVNTKVLYHLNEANSPSTTFKEEVVGDTGTASGACVRSGGKPLSPGVYFDGVDDYISAGTTAADITTGDFTFEGWAKPSTFLETYGEFIAKRQVGDTGYQMFLGQSDGAIHVYIKDTVGTADYQQSTLTLTYNAWQHLALSADRDGNMTVYKDGVAGTPQAMTTGNLTNTGKFEIGTQNSGLDYDYKGNIDEVRVSNIARKSFGGMAPEVLI